ncbi:hypothetical protein [Xanthobacter sediminis]
MRLKTSVAACAVAVSVVFAWQGAAAETTKQFGSWQVRTDKDRFSGETKVIAMLSQEGRALAVRCFPKGLSVMLFEAGFGAGRFSEGMPFDVAFRADEKPILETFGLGLSDKAIQIAESEKIIEQMKDAKEYAFRLTYKSITFDMVFDGGKGGRPAISEILKSCPLPK